MQGAQASRFSDGRLHLHHGPIDLIIEGWGNGRDAAYARATKRFRDVLDELMGEISILRRPVDHPPDGPIARRMHAAAHPHNKVFVTPMAAIAGAVADEICGAMQGAGLERAYVNNGGDIAVFLTEGQALTAAIHDGKDAGRVRFLAKEKTRGLATSGWRGRSHSFGIADAVTVVARDAASADVAATLIANAVDLPGHAAITRSPACELAPDSDLGERLVTVAVGHLSPTQTQRALMAGARAAKSAYQSGLIEGAVLFLNGKNVQVGQAPGLLTNGAK